MNSRLKQSGYQSGAPTAHVWAQACGVSVFCIGLLVFVGWVLDIPLLRSIFPGWVEMKTNTSVGYMAAGAALWCLARPEEKLWCRIAGLSLSVFLILLGSITTAQYMIGIDFGIDQIIFKEAAGAVGTTHPNRMAAASAVNFILKGLALFIIDFELGRRFRPSQVLSVVTAIAPAQAIIGYAYGVQTLFGRASSILITQMAIHAAVAWLLLSIGTVLARPGEGLLHPFSGRKAASKVWFRTLLACIFVPPIVGLLISAGLRAGVFEADFGLSIMVVTSVVFMGSAVWFGAYRTGRMRETEILTENALAESERQFRSLADTLPTLAWMAHADGYIHWYNKRWYEFTGTNASQMEGWGWMRVHDPLVIPLVLERWKASIEFGNPFEMEFPLKGADGTFRMFLTRVVPVLDSMGKVAQWFGTNTDIDEQSRTRDELRKALSHRDEFLSIASHELKTPITSLKLQLQMANKKIGKTVDEPASLEGIARSIKISAQQVDRLTKLVEDLLDVSRIQAGKVSLNLEEFDLSEFLTGLASRYNEEHFGGAVELHSQLPEGIIVKWDRDRIEQVFANLFSNAEKYAVGKTVRITAAPSPLGISISVKDDGPGIRKDRQAAIFERFERATSSRNISGLGLGLYIVKKIITEHGGCIAVVSEGGMGTEFAIQLPYIANVIPIGVRHDRTAPL